MDYYLTLTYKSSHFICLPMVEYLAVDPPEKQVQVEESAGVPALYLDSKVHVFICVDMENHKLYMLTQST